MSKCREIKQKLKQTKNKTSPPKTPRKQSDVGVSQALRLCEEFYILPALNCQQWTWGWRGGKGWPTRWRGNIGDLGLQRPALGKVPWSPGGPFSSSVSWPTSIKRPYGKCASRVSRSRIWRTRYVGNNVGGSRSWLVEGNVNSHNLFRGKKCIHNIRSWNFTEKCQLTCTNIRAQGYSSRHLFMTAKDWKRPTCSSVRKLVK